MRRQQPPDSDRTDAPGDPRDAVTVATLFAQPLARVLTARGHDAQRVLGELASAARPPRVSFRRAAEAWEAAVTATREPALGVVVASALLPGDFGVMEYLARTSPSLRAAAERLGRFHRLMNDATQSQLTLSRGLARVRYLVPTALEMPRAYLEFVLASWAKLVRESASAPQVLLAARLPFPPPREPGPYQSLAPQVEFGAPEASLVLRAAALDERLTGADPKLTAVMEAHARAVLAPSSTPAAPSWKERVAEAVAAKLADGTPRLDSIAVGLGVRARALRDRLTAEHSSFAAVVDEVRRSTARALLQKPELSLGEIAFLVGFSEPSAFHRAFRRWEGHSPRAARRR